MQYTRQADLLDETRVASARITLVGAGGIGSVAALGLAKMGFRNLCVIDHDHVEEVNLSSQIYRVQDAAAGTPKAVALGRVLAEMAGIDVEAIVADATQMDLSGIVIAAVDSMATRAALWARLRGRPAVEWYLDGRMGGESAALYAVRPWLLDDQREYERSLYSDADAVPQPCTGRAIAYGGLIIGGMIGRHVKRIVMGQSVERRIEYDLDELMFVVG